jgi:hypothetical protein
VVQNAWLSFQQLRRPTIYVFTESEVRQISESRKEDLMT